MKPAKGAVRTNAPRPTAVRIGKVGIIDQKASIAHFVLRPKNGFRVSCSIIERVMNPAKKIITPIAIDETWLSTPS